MKRLMIAMVLGWSTVTGVQRTLVAAEPGGKNDYDVALPNESMKRPFAAQTPITFVSRGTNRKEWESLKDYFNEVTEEAIDPANGKTVKRKAIKIKMPLGLNVLPTIPVENPMTLEKWKLGKSLYFDPILSSDGTVSCSSCHSPSTGFGDALKTSKGIDGKIGGMNAPTVMNSAFNRLQFWDGRADSLEAQAQGPPQNPIEMFDGKGVPWHEAIKRIRASKKYVGEFEKEFGHAATRDASAKAIATYERTVLVGNSLADRAEVAARKRAEDEESNKFDPIAKDYETVLNEAVAAKDAHALKALNLTDAKQIPAMAKSISNGRILFLNKARCNSCHVGETLTDHSFHNLGVGVVGGKIPEGQEGRFGAQATGQKDPTQMGAFKTPPLRGLVASAPYMHDGAEKTLEAVIDFYDKGGNANEYLDSKMRDIPAEQAYLSAKAGGPKYTGPEPTVFTSGGRPIIPLKLGLTPEEKKDLANYMRALEGDPIPAVLQK